MINSRATEKENVPHVHMGFVCLFEPQRSYGMCKEMDTTGENHINKYARCRKMNITYFISFSGPRFHINT